MSAPKKVKVMQKFSDAYTKEWPSMVPSKLSVNHARCTTHSINFSIGHGARDDIRRHVNTLKHHGFMKIQSSAVPLNLMFKCTVSSEEEDIMRAELLFNKFVVEQAKHVRPRLY